VQHVVGVVEDVARVVGVVASMIGTVGDAGEEVIDAHQICVSSMIMADQHRSHPCVLHGRGGEAVDADGEREAVHHSHEVGDDKHLARLGSCTHTPYLARHCRRKPVGSLPWGIPTVVVYR